MLIAKTLPRANEFAGFDKSGLAKGSGLVHHKTVVALPDLARLLVFRHSYSQNKELRPGIEVTVI